MPRYWHDSKQCIARDGRLVCVPFLLGPAQIDRWADAGYDIHAAIDRFVAFRAAWRGAPDGHVADALSRSYFSEERARAVEQGLSLDDADLWLFERAPRQYRWSPDLADIPNASAD